MSQRLAALQRYVLEQPRSRGKGASAVVRLVLRMGFKALLGRLFSRAQDAAALTCDVLLVHPSRKSFLQGRKKPFIEALRQRGLRVEEFVEESDGEQLRQRQLARPPQPVPFLLGWPAAHAAFLLRRYQPKVVLTERNGWIVPSFIKAFSQQRTRVMHLAHSVPTAQSSRYDYFDYDYYLMFGRSSFEYLSGLRSGFGECTALYAGPYFLADAAPPVETGAGERWRCLFLGSGPEYEATADYQAMCGWVRQWAVDNGVALAVKPHPRAAGLPWRDDPLVESIEPGVRLDDVLARFDLVLCGYTNAVLDVARSGVPFILLGEGEDFFQTGRFALARARSVVELDEARRAIRADLPGYRERLVRFLRFHIENPYQPCASLVEYVHRAVAGEELSGVGLAAKKQR
ncbi:hypothetical protein D9M68_152240 [compost metagenome]